MAFVGRAVMRNKKLTERHSTPKNTHHLSTIKKLSICGKIACYLFLCAILVLSVLSAFFIFGI